MKNCSLMKVKSIAECSKWSILQYFWSALNDNWSWKPITRSKAVVLLLLIRCWLLLPLWDSVIFLCFVVQFFVSILVLQPSWWGRESWLLCFAFFFVFLVSHDRCVALPHDATGLFAVCDCGISDHTPYYFWGLFESGRFTKVLLFFRLWYQAQYESWSGSILFAIYASKLFKKIIENVLFVSILGEKLKSTNLQTSDIKLFVCIYKKSFTFFLIINFKRKA